MLYETSSCTGIGTALLSIIILGLVALFIGLRLYSVLGERTGHEQSLTLKPAEPKDSTIAPPRTPASSPVSSGLGESAGDAYLPTAGPGVRALLAADPTFDVARFLEGSQAAYKMILEAFWRGEMDEVRGFVDGEILTAFEQSVADRKAAGHRLDNRLVAIEHALIASASVQDKVAVVAVRFEADIAAVNRNEADEVVAGSLSDAVQTRDKWTFRRNLGAADPNWILVETDDDD